MSFIRRWLGQSGEHAAAKYLRRRGWKIVERNYTCPAGEIDLIADDGTAIVFVEVRTRSTNSELDAGSVFPPAKRRQVSKVARAWIQAHRHLERAYRIDAILVNPAAKKCDRILHVEDAIRP